MEQVAGDVTAHGVVAWRTAAIGRVDDHQSTSPQLSVAIDAAGNLGESDRRAHRPNRDREAHIYSGFDDLRRHQQARPSGPQPLAHIGQHPSAMERAESSAEIDEPIEAGQ